MRYFLMILAVTISLMDNSPIRADVRAEIRKLVPEASAMKQADFERLARSAMPKKTDVDEKSLTLMLWNVEITPDASEAQNKEFRYHRPPKPRELVDEVYRVALRVGKRVVLKGPVTFLSADRITNVTAGVEGEQAVGTVSFKAPKLYEGTVHYTARRQDNAWRITEWRLPAHGMHLVYDDETSRWTRVEDP